MNYWHVTGSIEDGSWGTLEIPVAQSDPVTLVLEALRHGWTWVSVTEYCPDHIGFKPVHPTIEYRGRRNPPQRAT